MAGSMRIDAKAFDRIRKMINAARSWRESGDPHDANQAVVALGRARALCARLDIDQALFAWPDKPKPSMAGLRGTRADYVIIDDPFDHSIPIKTVADLIREARAKQQRRDALRRFRAAIIRQGFAANNTREAMRLFQEAMAASMAAKESKR